MNTNEKGDIAELKVALRAREMGMMVSRPMFDSARYDLILDDGIGLKRVQIKWAAGKSIQSEGSAYVELRRHNRKEGGQRVYQEGEVDLLIVYLPDVDKLCVFGPEMFVGKRGLSIRYKEAKNGQTKGCLMVEEYEWK